MKSILNQVITLSGSFILIISTLFGIYNLGKVLSNADIQSKNIEVGECVRELGNSAIEKITAVTETHFETLYGPDNDRRDLYKLTDLDKTVIKVSCK